MVSIAAGFGYGIVFLIAIAALVLAVLGWTKIENVKSKQSTFHARTTSLAATGGVTGADAFVLLDVLGTGADSDDTGFQTVLTNYISTAKGENRLAVTFSAVTDLVAAYTLATGGVGGLAADVASIEARVLIDGVQAEPGTITFDQMLRTVTLSEEFPAISDLISTSEAHSFTFVKARVCPGCHVVQVQVRAVASASLFGLGIASAAAAIGARSIVVLASKDASCSPSSSSSPCCVDTCCEPSTPSCGGCPSSSSSSHCC